MADLTRRPGGLTYDQLVEAVRRQLPVTEWTDHNASDPGMMLVELLAWLAEMVAYRMDHVPDTLLGKFLDFVIDPPEPVTVDVEFTATFQAAPATAAIVIPSGTLLATDFASGRRFVFETYQPLTLTRPGGTPPFITKGTRTARALLEITSEPLGVSDASPDQVFTLRPPRTALGLSEQELPYVLTDFVHRTSTYEPNPRVTAGGLAFSAVPVLKAESSRVSAGNLARHFMVEPYESRIRFGDGTFGAIPPVGVVTCDRYAILDGPRALAVRAGDVRHLLNVAVPPDVTLVMANSDATGGLNFHPADERVERGLRDLRAPYRLITVRDFERAVLRDFSEFQGLAGDARRFLRVSVELDRRPPLTEDISAPSHVTLALIPGAPLYDDALFRRDDISVATKQAMLQVPEDLWQRLRRFLDPRRLITTKLHRDTPELVPFTMTAAVVARADTNLTRVQALLSTRVHDFLSVVQGGFDRGGWRLGTNVYRSQLFRLMEDATDIVDHVDTLSLSPADAEGNVVLGRHQLPLLQSLTLTVVRGER